MTAFDVTDQMVEAAIKGHLSSDTHMYDMRAAIGHALKASGLLEALAFYADPNSWKAQGHPQIDGETMPILCDGGAIARRALEGQA